MGFQDLNVLLLSHSLVECFGSLSCWNTHPRPIFNALALTVHGPIHRPFDAVQLSCPLSRKTPPKHVSNSMFDVGVGVLGGHRQHSSSSKHGELSWCQRARSWSHLTTTLSTQFSSESLANFRRAYTCAFLSRGTSRMLQDFSPSRRRVCYQLFSWWLSSQLPWDHWQDPPV